MKLTLVKVIFILSFVNSLANAKEYKEMPENDIRGLE